MINAIFVHYQGIKDISSNDKCSPLTKHPLLTLNTGHLCQQIIHIILYHITKNSLVPDLITCSNPLSIPFIVLCVCVCVCAGPASFKTTLKLHFQFYNARKEKTILSIFVRMRIIFLLRCAMQGPTNTESSLPPDFVLVLQNCKFFWNTHLKLFHTYA
jgi:hypothetical protein